MLDITKRSWTEMEEESGCTAFFYCIPELIWIDLEVEVVAPQ